jgi:hypothetical protein
MDIIVQTTAIVKMLAILALNNRFLLFQQFADFVNRLCIGPKAFVVRITQIVS